ncbi:hypothetical protein C0Q70_08405 [Pomacea canaliculata]|uniref:Reverse transcriptase domain-containing protein n=1 Tax=Pomacea canaliculata TaxID=400727 RepID=A0A2T7PHR0_POMCA|nr:hypothetical protein C0Q70_08405 [Pomacea canaliculata]
MLLQRLSSEAGIQGAALQWIASYLAERSQRVIVGSASSEAVPLVCGVPQCSVLGPLLFSLYVSQLGRVIERFQMGRQFFADDTQILSSFSPDPAVARVALQRLESCCVAVKAWMTSNRLKLNDDKTEALLCGPRARREQIGISAVQVGDASIAFADCVRDLGLFIDAELSMCNHVSSVVAKSYYFLRTLGRLRPMLTQAAANSLAVATITSGLDYCNSALWGIPATQLDRLQRVQNAAARIVFRAKSSTEHITPILQSLHWLPMNKRIDHKVLSIAKDFSLLRNVVVEVMVESDDGRAFHSLGAAFLKALAPVRFLLVSVTAGRQKRDWEPERRPRDGWYGGTISCK